QDHLEHLFTQNYRSLCQLSYSFVKNMDVAKDIVQDFFIQYWEKFKHQELHINFDSYAYVAVKNRSLNYLKSQEVKLRHEHHAGDTLYEMEVAPGDTDMDGKDRYKMKLLKAMDQLPAGQRKVFMLSAVDGLKYMEIATQMNISINTVKTQIRKAYQAIRKNCDVTTILVMIFSGVTLFLHSTVFI
ncbi:MAG TPA: RNA polymerase sigma-70 factor, partial [Chitinophaga sp.]